MPSAFIVEQAGLLHRTKDTFAVLQRIRDKYALSSFPSQMSRVKEVWYKYEDRHENYETMYRRGLQSLVSQQVSSRFISQYRHFHEDNVKEQVRKSKLASTGKLTGSTRTDRLISRIPILPEYMSDYRLTKEDISKNSVRAEKCLEKRAMDCIVVRNGEDLVKKCRKIVKELNEDVFVIAAALAVLAGRRSIEILKVGTFQKCATSSYSTVFTGTAKKRRGDSKTDCNPASMKDQECSIPLLVKYKYLQPAIIHVRSLIEVGDMTNSQINSKYSHKLGDAAKILMANLKTRFHDLRAVYGCISHEFFENNCSINIWLKKVLMHDNIDTSVFYSRCKVHGCKSILGKWDVDVKT